MKRTLIYIDPDVPLGSLELLGVMERMYGPDGSRSYGLCAGGLDEGIANALDHVILIEGLRLGAHDVVTITSCIEDLQRKHVFDAILIPATTFGRMLAPRAAMRLHAGLVADVTGIRRRNGEVEMVRPAFSGRMFAGVVSRGEGPIMMTVRRNVFSYEKRESGRAEIHSYAPRTSAASRARTRRRASSRRSSTSLATAIL